MSWRCDNCRSVFYGEEDEQYYCALCGATVCENCISLDPDICKECEE